VQRQAGFFYANLLIFNIENRRGVTPRQGSAEAFVVGRLDGKLVKVYEP